MKMDGKHLLVLIVLPCTILSCQSVQKDGRSASDRDAEQQELEIEDRNAMFFGVGLSHERIDDATHIIGVGYSRSGTVGPRVVALHIEYTGNLGFIDAEEGNSVQLAEKELFVQEIHNRNIVRLAILASANTNELNTGVLAKLKFRKIGNEKAMIRILADHNIFAPQEANEGLLIGDPLTF